ncbi:MAG TPA: hypothetical protein VFT99_09355, partial [Roseiflexaceae bacterium]|nr:hypothetical protein [Roseiflexaceae bacterium]
MPTETMNIQLIIAFAGPILTALLGALGIYLQEWREQRDARSLRLGMRSEASDYVGLLVKWLDAQQRVCSESEYLDAKQRVRQELDRLYTAFSAEPPVKQTLDAQAAQTFVQRALLLYRPARPLGWIARLLYFAFLLIVALYSFSIVEEVSSGRMNWSVALFGYVLYVVPLLLMRSWAVAIDRRATAE